MSTGGSIERHHRRPVGDVASKALACGCCIARGVAIDVDRIDAPRCSSSGRRSPTSCGTTAPTTNASMSTKFCDMLRMKYSSAMLRPPGDRHRAVGDEQLVVHAVVEPAEVEQRRREARQRGRRARAAERVEQAHLDVRERRQPAQQLVAARRCRGRRRSRRTRTPRSRRVAQRRAAAGGRCRRSRSGSTGRRASASRALRELRSARRASRRRAAAGARPTASSSGGVDAFAILTSGLSGLERQRGRRRRPCAAAQPAAVPQPPARARSAQRRSAPRRKVRAHAAGATSMADRMRRQ